MNFCLLAIGLFVLTVLILTRIARYFLTAPEWLPVIMKKIHFQIRIAKPKLFKEAFEQVNTRNESGNLDILELGIGSGENFKCFPPNSNITILDNTDTFLPLLEESIKEHRNDLTISKLVVCSAEKMTSIESNSMDVVLHTFLLCGIPDTSAVLNEICRVLKPGGVFIFIDHAAEQKNSIRQLAQTILAYIMDDCRFKDIRKIVNSGPFEKVVFKDYTGFTGLLAVFNPLV